MCNVFEYDMKAFGPGFSHSPGPISLKLTLPQIARYVTRKQASPLAHFSRPASSGFGLKRHMVGHSLASL